LTSENDVIGKDTQHYVVAHLLRVATRKLGVETPETIFACGLIFVHLLDTLLTAGGNPTRDHRYRSSNAIGRYRISAHRGDRENPGPDEGTDDPGRLAAW
jgi:hypothetical protein